MKLARLFAVLAIAIAGSANASAPMVFQNIGLDDGLSQSTVMASFQDSRGYIWIATENGLNRYNGQDIVVYGREPGNRSALSSDYIWAIDEDANGDIWLATDGGGVAVWARESDEFSSFRHNPDDENSISSDSVRNLLIDQSGTVWIATRASGLNRLDALTGKITRFESSGESNNSLVGNTLFAMLEDRDGNIWVGTERGLSRYSSTSGAFEAFDLGEPMRDKSVFALAEDSAGNIWAGIFEGGLAQLNPVSKHVIHYQHDPDDVRSLSSNDVRAIIEDRDSRLWIGTANGLNLLDRRDGLFARYHSDGDNPLGLSDDFIMSLSQDDAGLLWVGTRHGGVHRWNPRSWSFGHQLPDWLDGAYVSSFADDTNGNLWVGTIGAGLNRIDRGNDARRSFDEFVTNGAALPDERVMSLLADSADNLWIGTLNGGLSRLNSDGELVSFSHSDSDPSSIGADGIMTLIEDRIGRIWIGTFGGGVSQFTPETGAFRRYPAADDNSNPLHGARATAIAEDKHGYLWIGTDGSGLILLDSNRGVVQQFRHDPSDASSLSSNTVYSIHIDDDNTIWLGTAGGGLNKLTGDSRQPANIVFRNFGRNIGINDVVYGVQADASGFLWLSTNRGLAQFDRVSETARTFHKSHGLQDEEFNSGAHHRAANGRLVFGGARGFNSFLPHELQLSESPPRVVLARFEVLNKPVPDVGPVAEISTIDLAYNDDVVSFEFATLDYVDPSRNRVAYRLRGFDEDFIETGSSRRITYTNLDAGNYVLQVKAVAADNVWSDIALEIPVSVRAAPWQTWWAYTLYALFTVAVIFWLLRHQNVKLRNEEASARRLAAEVKERTAELSQRNLELKEASEAKSNFLARMSHEIRTPMNGVIGMTELLRGTDLTTRQAEFTRTISQSAESLLQIINDILDLSKIESGRFVLDEHSFSLSDAVEDVTALLGTVASKKELELIGFVDPESAPMLIGDESRLRQILINLVGNAIKFTDAGEVKVHAYPVSNDGYKSTIRIEVSDTGMGIPTDKLSYVFDAFSQADESTTQRFGGTGLGLSICRHLVTMMGGKIGVDSKSNIGSTFWCEVPFGISRESAVDRRVDLTGCTVLVATPFRSLQQAISRHITANNGDVVLAGTTSELATMCASGAVEPDTIVIDTDALDAFRAEQSLQHLQKSGVHIIFLSRDPDIVDAFAPEQFPNSTIIRKPLKWASLLKSISSAAGMRTNPESGAVTPQTPRRPRVLVIEDNMVNQLVAEGMLSELNCDVIIASDGRRGVAKATTENYDLILMDAQMPDMDGFQATQLIREWESGGQYTPIVGVSASASDEIGADCKRAGMDDFLSKPYVLEVLDNIVQRWTSNWAGSRNEAEPEPLKARRRNMIALDPAALEDIQRLQSDARPDVLSRVLEMFLEGSCRLVAELGRGRSERCLTTLGAAAHALKSSSASVGAGDFSDVARDLEDACRSEDADAALDLSVQLEAMYGPVSNAVVAEIRKESS